MFIEVTSPAEAVEAATQAIINHGDFSSPRDQATVELMNATIKVNDPYLLPMHLKNRKLGSFTGAIETLQLVGQTSVPEFVTDGAPTFRPFTNDGIFLGAYGIRVHGRLAPLVEQLKKDPDTRQAVLTIFDSRTDLFADSRDVPCTLSLQFFIRNRTLCARTTMRSNDAYLGLPYDLTQFIGLQGAIAASLGMPMGWYAHSVGSLHLYAKDVTKAREVKAGDCASSGIGLISRQVGLWHGDTIGEISSRARSIIYGTMDYAGLRTGFESFLYQAIEARRAEMVV